MTTKNANKKKVSRTILGLMMGGAGVLHFTNRGLFDQLVPNSLDKYRSQINAATGALQAASAIGFLIPSLRGVARWSTVPLLLASFPEAINQIRHPERLQELGLPPKIAPVRVAAQTGILAWTWWATTPDHH